MTGADLDKPGGGPEKCAITRKICYRTKGEAVQTAKRRRAEARKNMTGKISVFQCGYCFQYHLGRR